MAAESTSSASQQGSGAGEETERDDERTEDRGREGRDDEERTEDRGREDRDDEERDDREDEEYEDEEDEERGSSNRSESRESSENERTGNFWAGFGQTLPMALAGSILLLYFVWLCAEMGSHAHDGLAIVIGTFAAILVGIVTAAVAVGLRSLVLKAKPDRDR